VPARDFFRGHLRTLFCLLAPSRAFGQQQPSFQKRFANQDIIDMAKLGGQGNTMARAKGGNRSGGAASGRIYDFSILE
jgi:hypothetical protein